MELAQPQGGMVLGASGGMWARRPSGQRLGDWNGSISRALAAGAIQDEMPDLRPSIALVAGLGRVVCAAPDVAIAPLEEPDDYRQLQARRKEKEWS